MARKNHSKHTGGGLIAAILDRLAVLLKGKPVGEVRRLFQAVEASESNKSEETIQ
jgi:hypothetical protein